MKFQETDLIILEADGKVNNEKGYGYLVKKRLEEYGIKSEIFSIVNEAHKLPDLPLKPMIISGGMTEVTADVKWVNLTKRFIGELITKNQSLPKEERTPVMGICFGAQLISESYQKKTVKYLDDPEVGASNITLSLEDHPLFEGFSKEMMVYAFHYNQIIVTKKVKVISKHEINENAFLQAFEVPEGSAYGVQFHPEFTYEEMLELLTYYEELVKELDLNVVKIKEELPEIEHNGIILKNFYEMNSKQL